MKKLLIIMSMVLIVALAMVVNAQDKPWFDMENCAFCKSLGEDPDMLMKIGWEHYNIENGSMSVVTVPAEYTEKWEVIRSGWEEAGKKLMAGENMHMCQMCTSMSGLMMKGTKSEEVKWSNGYISLMTSDNADIIKEIHAFTDRTNAELAAMEKAMMMEGDAHNRSHEGHNH